MKKTMSIILFLSLTLIVLSSCSNYSDQETVLDSETIYVMPENLPVVDDDINSFISSVVVTAPSFEEGSDVPADSFTTYFETFEVGTLDDLIKEEYEKYIIPSTNSIALPIEIFKHRVEELFAVNLTFDGSKKLSEDGECIILTRSVRDSQKVVVKEIIKEKNEVIKVCGDVVTAVYSGGDFSEAFEYIYLNSFACQLIRSENGSLKCISFVKELQ